MVLETKHKKTIAIASMGLLAVNQFSVELLGFLPDNIAQFLFSEVMLKGAAIGVALTIFWLINKEII